MQESAENVLELEPEEVLQLDLIITRRQLSDSEEGAVLLKLRLLQEELKKIQQEKIMRARDESILMTRIAQKAGVPQFKKMRVVGKNKIAYEV